MCMRVTDFNPYFNLPIEYLHQLYSPDLIVIGASLNEPHTSKSFVLSIIHKKLWRKIEELTNASIFVHVMVMTW